MSLLDTLLAAKDEAKVPEPNEHAPSTEFVDLLIMAVEKMRAAGRDAVKWGVKDEAFVIYLLDDGRVRVETPTGACTWIPGDELNIAIRSEKKLEALDQAIVGLTALLKE